MSASRPTLRFLSILLAAAFLAAAVHAATPGYGVTINAPETNASTGDTGCATFTNITVKNSGSAPGAQTISLAADPGDSGWTVDPAPPSSVSVAQGADSEPFEFGACPPADAEDGASGSITLTATVSSDPGPDKATASESFTATFMASAGTQNGTLDDENGTLGGNDTADDAGNDTGDNNDSPGIGAIAVIVAAVGAVVLARRRQ